MFFEFLRLDDIWHVFGSTQGLWPRLDLFVPTQRTDLAFILTCLCDCAQLCWWNEAYFQENHNHVIKQKTEHIPAF